MRSFFGVVAEIVFRTMEDGIQKSDGRILLLMELYFDLLSFDEKHSNYYSDGQYRFCVIIATNMTAVTVIRFAVLSPQTPSFPPFAFKMGK
jgi:hypothetical protein